MKLLQGSRGADISLMSRLSNAVHDLFIRLKFQRPLANGRQRYEAAIDSSIITPEQRRAALANAATDPEIEAALDEADASHEEFVKGLAADAVRGGSVSSSPSGN